MAAKHINVDKDSELGQALEAAREAGQRIVLEVGGHTYEFAPCEGTKENIWKNYDPERVREMLARTAGALKGVDAERLKREIREQRGHRVRRRPL